MAEFKYRKKRKEFKEQTRVRNNDYREIALTKMGKRQLMLTLLSIFGVTLLSIGSTFAMFTVSSKSAEYNVVKSGILNISFDADSSSTIGLNGALPTSDSDGLAQTGNTFTITNTGSLTAEYTVSLQDDKDMITQDNCSDKQLDKGFIKYNIDGTNIKLLSDSIDSTIISGSLKAGESKTFTLKLWIKEDATNEALGKHYHGKIVVDAIQEGVSAADKLVINANPESLEYVTSTDSQKKQMWTFSHEATDQTEALTDYRYIGATPNNYVKFNDELWRIIGVFNVDDGTGKIEKRLKIIRTESIGEFSFEYRRVTDAKQTSNSWNDKYFGNALNYLLNDNGAYYNRTTGKAYKDYALIDVDFTSIGLTEKSRNMIGNAVWYLGGVNSTEYNSMVMKDYYKYERSSNVPSDGNISWTGKVGLMYPSDHIFACGFGNQATRGYCLGSSANTWRGYQCGTNSHNWLGLAISANEEYYTITPLIDASNPPKILILTSFPNYTISSSPTLSDSSSIGTFPTVYLKSDVKIVSGVGSNSDPYILE